MSSTLTTIFANSKELAALDDESQPLIRQAAGEAKSWPQLTRHVQAVAWEWDVIALFRRAYPARSSFILPQ
jgi:hypothetical protein